MPTNHVKIVQVGSSSLHYLDFNHDGTVGDLKSKLTEKLYPLDPPRQPIELYSDIGGFRTEGSKRQPSSPISPNDQIIALLQPGDDGHTNSPDTDSEKPLLARVSEDYARKLDTSEENMVRMRKALAEACSRIKKSETLQIDLETEFTWQKHEWEQEKEELNEKIVKYNQNEMLHEAEQEDMRAKQTRLAQEVKRLSAARLEDSRNLEDRFAALEARFDAKRREEKMESAARFLLMEDKLRAIEEELHATREELYSPQKRLARVEEELKETQKKLDLTQLALSKEIAAHNDTRAELRELQDKHRKCDISLKDLKQRSSGRI
ncbi:hypothetical protein BXZ70DRAFT_556809 [Cristinia sonorae]|uniref:Uncharacterized protein n=1 Tax=Cristinia sonorae TaxID=1940300 RepID=A0A8K0UFT5_9AGAR|nr:hypothetical protein BXZ70DRAFT_556809 [Cristinia sonorae]